MLAKRRKAKKSAELIASSGRLTEDESRFDERIWSALLDAVAAIEAANPRGAWRIVKEMNARLPSIRMTGVYLALIVRQLVYIRVGTEQKPTPDQVRTVADEIYAPFATLAKYSQDQLRTALLTAFDYRGDRTDLESGDLVVMYLVVIGVLRVEAGVTVADLRSNVARSFAMTVERHTHRSS